MMTAARVMVPTTAASATNPSISYIETILLSCFCMAFTTVDGAEMYAVDRGAEVLLQTLDGVGSAVSPSILSE